MGVLDRLHGTDEMFRRSKNYERHVVLLGTDSARQLIPNPPKKADTTDCNWTWTHAAFHFCIINFISVS